MAVLVFNPGSNSLKFAWIEPHCSGDVIGGHTLLSGEIEPIGASATISIETEGKPRTKQPISISDYGDAAGAVVSRVEGEFGRPDKIACRVVHGGGRFTSPSIVNAQVLSEIEKLEDMAPLHNASSVAVIREMHKHFGDAVPVIAVWDSGFHHTIPPHAHLYAIPPEISTQYGVRRYGFHGISHRYLMLRYAELKGRKAETLRLITLHLEGGSSACAIAGGKSVDTSMGFTPLEGLVMGTRSGDIDPSVIPFLAKKQGLDPQQVEEWLNTKCGLLGVSGISQDTRVLMKHIADPRARLALDIFAYRVRKYLGAYLAVLNGADAIVFGGGIGENTPHVRQLICEHMDALGLKFDALRNGAVVDREGCISADDSPVEVFVIPSNEELMIACEASLPSVSP